MFELPVISPLVYNRNFSCNLSGTKVAFKKCYKNCSKIVCVNGKKLSYAKDYAVQNAPCCGLSHHLILAKKTVPYYRTLLRLLIFTFTGKRYWPTLNSYKFGKFVVTVFCYY